MNIESMKLPDAPLPAGIEPPRVRLRASSNLPSDRDMSKIFKFLRVIEANSDVENVTKLAWAKYYIDCSKLLATRHTAALNVVQNIERKTKQTNEKANPSADLKKYTYTGAVMGDEMEVEKKKSTDTQIAKYSTQLSKSAERVCKSFVEHSNTSKPKQKAIGSTIGCYKQGCANNAISASEQWETSSTTSGSRQGVSNNATSGSRQKVSNCTTSRPKQEINNTTSGSRQKAFNNAASRPRQEINSTTSVSKKYVTINTSGLKQKAFNNTIGGSKQKCANNATGASKQWGTSNITSGSRQEAASSATHGPSQAHINKGVNIGAHQHPSFNSNSQQQFNAWTNNSAHHYSNTNNLQQQSNCHEDKLLDQQESYLIGMREYLESYRNDIFALEKEIATNLQEMSRKICCMQQTYFGVEAVFEDMILKYGEDKTKQQNRLDGYQP